MNMAAIKSRDTIPEVIIRRLLRSMRYKYTANADSLPGKPDIYIKSRRTVIFVHGCFWHQHGDCKISRDPSKMDLTWKLKFIKSSKYDLNVISDLENINWQVLILWSHLSIHL